MADYFFIQSQDQFTDVRTRAQYNLAISIANSGKQVKLFLVQNAVFGARSGVSEADINKLIQNNVKIYADVFSLKQREIDPMQLQKSIETANIDIAVTAMLNGDKVIWW